MKNPLAYRQRIQYGHAAKPGYLVFCLTLATLSVVLSAIGLIPLQVSAQTKHKQINIAGVAVRQAANGTDVSIAADGPLEQTQVWQDGEGYHVSVPNARIVDSIKVPQGVTVRQIGTAVEITVQANPGETVELKDANAKPAAPEDPAKKDSVSVDELAKTLPSIPPREPVSDRAKPAPASEGFGVSAWIANNPAILAIIAVSLFGLLIILRVRSYRAARVGLELTPKRELNRDEWAPEVEDHWQPADTGANLVKGPAQGTTPGSRGERKSTVSVPVTTPASVYGAYRIDQEVSKLILNQAHGVSVLASRAPDDRRAMEASLLKVITSPDSDENQRRKAREALEEYGFVARHCASLLLAPDAFERTSAARSLGEIKSPMALPFLLEGLYDQESIVRNQAVVSIGELKMPSAIGALLDMARRHFDAASVLVSRALSSCTFETLDSFDPATQQQLFTEDFSREITQLQPATSVEDLPETSDDEALAQAIGKLNSKDAEVRVEAVKSLAQYPVQTAVSGLALVARLDPEPSIRAMAISSLSLIDHESVFSAVLIGMADDSREVRAAAARSLSRLSFDRADAYVRVLENADKQMLREVAGACITSGIVAQNIDRLQSNDPRQSYEAFSLISLLAKAGMIEPVLQAISNHSNISVRLAAIHLLASTDQAEIVGDLRKIVVEDGTPEEVKTDLLEAIYKLEQSKPAPKEARESPWLSAQTELMDSKKSERNSDFDFRPAFESELKQETQIHLDEFEM